MGKYPMKKGRVKFRKLMREQNKTKLFVHGTFTMGLLNFLEHSFIKFRIEY